MEACKLISLFSLLVCLFAAAGQTDMSKLRIFRSNKFPLGLNATLITLGHRVKKCIIARYVQNDEFFPRHCIASESLERNYHPGIAQGKMYVVSHQTETARQHSELLVRRDSQQQQQQQRQQRQQNT